jgi:hypothetical protein
MVPWESYFLPLVHCILRWEFEHIKELHTLFCLDNNMPKKTKNRVTTTPTTTLRAILEARDMCENTEGAGISEVAAGLFDGG